MKDPARTARMVALGAGAFALALAVCAVAASLLGGYAGAMPGKLRWVAVIFTLIGAAPAVLGALHLDLRDRLRGAGIGALIAVLAVLMTLREPNKVGDFSQTFVNALALGSLYALIALGYTLVYGVLRFINFAHSDIVTWSAWIAATVAGTLGWATTGSPVFAMPVVLVLTMAICAAMGVTIEIAAYRPLRKAPRLNVLITAIGVSLLLQNLGQLDKHPLGIHTFFGTMPKPMPPLISDDAVFSIGNVRLATDDIVIVVLTAFLMIAMQWLVYMTRLGRAMRAVSFDERTASLMGVNVNRVISATFAIGSALAAAGGVLYGLKYDTLKQTADAGWVLLGLKAFVAAVVGGIGNVRGAVAGALLIGGIEIFGTRYLPMLSDDMHTQLMLTQLRDVYVFGILILVLLFKPSGLFGKAVVEKV